MKKGFILALMVVALMAMVISASAKAPIINDGSFPTVIVGDADDAAGGMGIFRYLNAVDLADSSIVDWNNDDSYTTDLFHAYIYPDPATTDTIDMNVCDPSGLIDDLSLSEYNALVGSGTVPAASTRITSGTADGSYQFMYLSFVNSAVDSAVTDPYNDAVSMGHALTSFSTYNQSAMLTLVCAVTSGTQLINDEDSMHTFEVMCKGGESDTAETAFSTEEEYDFVGDNDGWEFATQTGFPAGTALVEDGSIGFADASYTELTYATWESPYNLAADDAAQAAGKVYRAMYTMAGTGSDSDSAPGWRVRFVTESFSHYGKVTMEGDAQFGEENKPYSGQGITGRLYWAVPSADMFTEMADDESLATLFDLDGDTVIDDLRKYRVTFDLLGGSGESGVLKATDVVVHSFTRPETGTPVISWGTPGANNPGGVTGDAFNATEGIWQNEPAPGGFTGNAAVIGANSVVLQLASGATQKWSAATSQDFVSNVNLLQAESMKLYRLAFEVACADQYAVPIYRVNVNQFYRSGLTWPIAESGTKSLSWAEYFAYSGITSTGVKSPFFKMTGQDLPPMSPNTTDPSLVESYVYSHDILATGYSNLLPIFSLVDVGNYDTGVWPVPTTAMTYSYVSWEDLGSEY